MIDILDANKENLIAIKLTGKATQADMERIHELIHGIVDKGQQVDFYMEFENFHGYDMKGLWEDLKIDTAHFSDYGRMAFVGDKKWLESAAKATDFFTASDVRYFDRDDKQSAKEWLEAE
ncbi:STAS/SEC14 domain-containing protein [Pseudidiomarina terrestris]|uniref:STAS/SEC14 domain-containing protein n=1 Tax=Pseudidiomarina terrestris TaxID=2820060 RepID=A0AAW7QZ74_9GAMM|nr:MULTISPECIES: STAS/SEC14 domain-containing protein [unclassified Pseudidiomarina]MDN7125501.1 STAS/SEC14 domain-containing protein [Pseudidiomarina sp. 1APP75-32.1]MDN7128067.1 STAS/SEC14 domain-containing protein [Pseudidiomarina sp. 1APR75-33.1]MDN7130259.1 STAS/SEC14 domain-containing protein [Pseudidiomarina sp. 1APR75-15]MDN7135769.1 STAS/SEC14 domain-containing protein [Pseudidiomarina sp. 1ASP75-5]MDN7137195.1 STAS/SEC14 domain-containing protein [Pseudidiomarina sp. 1ASP75-14]